jgi:hypothetical protein
MLQGRREFYNEKRLVQAARFFIAISARYETLHREVSGE